MQSLYVPSLPELKSAKGKRQSQLSALLKEEGIMQLWLETASANSAQPLLSPCSESIRDQKSQLVRLQLTIHHEQEQLSRIERLEQVTLSIHARKSALDGLNDDRGKLWAEIFALENQHAASQEPRNAASDRASTVSTVARLLNVRESTARVVDNELLRGRIASLAAAPVPPQKVWQTQTQQEHDELAGRKAQVLSLQTRLGIAESQIAAVTNQPMSLRAARTEQVKGSLQRVEAERDNKAPTAQRVLSDKAQQRASNQRTLQEEGNRQSALQQAHRTQLDDCISGRLVSSAAAMSWMGGILREKVRETQASLAEAADLRARLLAREVQQAAEEQNI